MEENNYFKVLKCIFVSIFMILSFEFLLLSQTFFMDLLIKIDVLNSVEIKLVFSMLYQVICYLIIFYFFKKFFNIAPCKNRKPLRPKILYLSLFIVAYFMSASALSFFTYIVDISPGESELFFNDLIISYPWFAVISALLIAPICEEIFFRYFIMRYLKTQMSPAFAILISALLFGAFHLNLRQFIFAGALGVVLGLFYEAGGRLKHSIFIHFSFNLASFLGIVFLIKPYIVFPITILMLVGTLKYSYKMDSQEEL